MIDLKPFPLLVVMYIFFVGIRFLLNTSFADTASIFIDELLYKSLGMSFAENGNFYFRSNPSGHQHVLYGVAIAPAFKLFSFYNGILLINSFLMNAVIFPVYLIAKRFIGHKESLIVAALSVLIPSMYYSSFVVSENLFFPLLMFAIYFMIKTFDNYSPLNVFTVCLFTVLAILTRLQGVTLITTFGAISVLLFFIYKEQRKKVVITGTIALCAMVLGAYGMTYLMLGKGLSSSGTSYASIISGHSLFMNYIRAFVTNAAVLVIITFVAPFLLSVVEIRGWITQRADRNKLVFAVIVALLTLQFLGLAAVLETNTNDFRLHERYLFYLIPLFFILAASRITKISFNTLWIGSLLSVLLVAVIPNKLLESMSILLETPTLIALCHLHNGMLSKGVLIICIVLGVLLLYKFNTSRFLIALAAVMILINGINYKSLSLSNKSSAAEVQYKKTIADNISPNDRVLILYSDGGNMSDYFRTEFFIPTNNITMAYFNKSMDGWGGIKVDIDDAGNLTGLDRPYKKIIAMDAAMGNLQVDKHKVSNTLSLYEHDGPLKIASQFKTGVYGDSWTGKETAVVVYANDQHKLSVVLSGMGLPQQVQAVTVTISEPTTGYNQTIVVKSGSSTTVDLPVFDKKLVYSFKCDKTFIPDEYLKNGDKRELGVILKIK